jgi:ribosomal protein S18 acetylase RimI-like enzyme
MAQIRAASSEDLRPLAALFDAYRQFYELPADPDLSGRFIEARFAARDSVLLVASDERRGLVGFCQLYPSWCSLRAAPIYILYDLYVDPACRREGVGRDLLRAAADRARQDGKVRMELTTARTNVQAQALYESLGWTRDTRFLTYNLAVG